MENLDSRREAAERWEDWKTPEYINVLPAVSGLVDHERAVPEHVHTREQRNLGPILLSRWDVQEILVFATEEAFGAPAAAPPSRRVPMFLRTSGKAAEVEVVRPTDGGLWVTEIRTAAGATAPRYYQAGPWILEIVQGSHWANIHGATDQGVARSYDEDAHAASSYRAMLHTTDQRRWRAAVTALLFGGAGDASREGAQAVRLAAASILSESMRSPRAWGANMMLLDLAPERFLGVLGDGLHPMARGGTFNAQVHGGQTDQATRAFETSIAMEWLVRHQLAARYPKPKARFRDPGRGYPHVNQIRRRYRAAMTQRFLDIADLLTKLT